MSTMLAGFGIALLVSIPPGANTALCVTRARDGARKAAPVIVGAAAVDSVYALLAAAGIIAASAFSQTVLHRLAAIFCIVAAIVLWRTAASSISTRNVIGMAALNPGTASLWLGLSALAIAHPHGSAIGYWVIGVAAGTAAWFSSMALVSARLHRRLTPRQQVTLQHGFAAALALVGLAFFV